jgi:hypothetical protein
MNVKKRILSIIGAVSVTVLVMACSSPTPPAGSAEPTETTGTTAPTEPVAAVDLSSTKPSLGSLVTGSTSVSTTPAFHWSTVKGATSYDLYVSTESIAGSLPYVSGLTDSPYVPTTPLANNAKYYWKVVARNSGSTSKPSDIRSFTTIKGPGFKAPVYQSPIDGSTIYPAGGFAWGSAPGTTNNRFLCSTKADASGLLAWDEGTKASVASSDFFFWPGYTWYWKVVAEDETTCSSDTSPVWSFTPATSGIAAPANIAVDSSFRITWGKVDKATVYYVLLNYGGTAFTWNSLAYLSTGTSFDASWLSKGKTIGYTVVALDAEGHTSYTASLAAAGTFRN